MTVLSNPLADMADMPGLTTEQADRPDDSFRESALPGFKQALTARRSIRAYDGVAIPEDIFRDCLRDAILAPSSSNLQTYQIYWLRDAAKRQAVASACLGQEAALSAGELVVVVARGDLWDEHRRKLIQIMTHGGEKPLSGPVADYYNRIIPMLMKTDPLGFRNLVRRLFYRSAGRKGPSMRTPVNRADHRIYAHVQATFAAQTLLLSLAAHGYDSCPIGGMDMKRIAKILELPKSAEASVVIAAGRGKPEGMLGPRVRLDESELIREV